MTTRLVFPDSTTTALAAEPIGRCSWRMVNVCPIEWMSVGAVRLPGVERERTLTPQDVFPLGHDLQMRRFAARRVPAQVVQRQAIEIESGEQLEDETVGVEAPGADSDLAVSELIASASPLRARPAALVVDVSSESNGHGHPVQRASPRRSDVPTKHVPQFQHPRLYTETLDGVP